MTTLVLSSGTLTPLLSTLAKQGNPCHLSSNQACLIWCMRAKGCGSPDRVIQRLYEVLKYCDGIFFRFTVFVSFIFTLFIMKNNDSKALSVQSSDTTDAQFPSIQKLDLSLSKHPLLLLKMVRHLAYLLCAPPDKPSCQCVINIDGNNINAVTLLIQVLSQYFVENAGYQVWILNTLNNLASFTPDDWVRDFTHTLEHWQQQWQVIYQMPYSDSTEYFTAHDCSPCGHILCISIILVSSLIIILQTLVLPAESPSHTLEEQWTYCVKSWISYVWPDLTIHIESLKSYQKLLMIWLIENGMKNLLIWHTMSILMVLWSGEYQCVLFELNEWIRPDHWWMGNYLDKSICIHCINKQVCFLLQSSLTGAWDIFKASNHLWQGLDIIRAFEHMGCKNLRLARWSGGKTYCLQICTWSQSSLFV